MSNTNDEAAKRAAEEDAARKAEAAAAKKAEDDAKAARKAELEERKSLIHVKNSHGEELWVHPTTLDSHKAVGWKPVG